MIGPTITARLEKDNEPIDLELGIIKDEKEAARLFTCWLADNRVRVFTSQPYPTLQGGEEEFFRRANSNHDEIHWGIYANGNYIGGIGLAGINRRNLHAELGIIIGDKNWWGKGIATASEILVTEYAFNNIVAGGLSKLIARVLTENHASRKALVNVGFRDAGLLRRHVWSCGRWFDVWLGDLLQDEWQAEKENRLESAGIISYNLYPGCEEIIS